MATCRPGFGPSSASDQPICVCFEVHFTVGEVAGEPTVGRTTPHWNVTSRARVEYNRGNIEIYLQQKGSIRAWVSEGKYDILA